MGVPINFTLCYRFTIIRSMLDQTLYCLGVQGYKSNCLHITKLTKKKKCKESNSIDYTLNIFYLTISFDFFSFLS